MHSTGNDTMHTLFMNISQGNSCVLILSNYVDSCVENYIYCQLCNYFSKSFILFSLKMTFYLMAPVVMVRSLNSAGNTSLLPSFTKLYQLYFILSSCSLFIANISDGTSPKWHCIMSQGHSDMNGILYGAFFFPCHRVSRASDMYLVLCRVRSTIPTFSDCFIGIKFLDVQKCNSFIACLSQTMQQISLHVHMTYASENIPPIKDLYI